MYLGASPRGSLNLYRSARRSPRSQGRDYVIPDDVKQLAVAVLGPSTHRPSQASLREVDADAIVREILSRSPVAEPTGPGATA